MIINNVTRLLDSHDVSYVAYELPGEKLSAREVSNYSGVPLGQVFKTIVVVRKRPGKPILAMVLVHVFADPDGILTDRVAF
jgi:prolyl-tRNA editing enzyme YbaK/EbsC (Cys-tRNA(Pro) deacylase)